MNQRWNVEHQHIIIHLVWIRFNNNIRKHKWSLLNAKSIFNKIQIWKKVGGWIRKSKEFIDSKEESKVTRWVSVLQLKTIWPWRVGRRGRFLRRPSCRSALRPATEWQRALEERWCVPPVEPFVPRFHRVIPVEFATASWLPPHFQQPPILIPSNEANIITWEFEEHIHTVTVRFFDTCF